MTDHSKQLPAGAPMLSVIGAAKALEFYKKAFGAIELMRLEGPDGSIGHSEIKIGGTVLMVADEHPEMVAMGWIRSPQSLGGSSVILQVIVDDVDALTGQAFDAGAKVITPPEDQFYGHRRARIADPFGHLWMFATVIEQLTSEDIENRSEALLADAANE